MRKQSQQVTEILHTHRNQARYIAVFLMLSALVISFVCSALMMPAVSMTYGDTVENGYPVYKTDPNAALGAATHFHIFAEEATFRAHVHGNVATNFFHAENKDFGVRKQYWDDMSAITYLKDFDGTLNGDTLATKLVLGNGSTVQEVDNGNKYRVSSPNGGTGELNRSSIRDGIFVEGSTPYIDITQELNNLADLSVNAASQMNTANITQSTENKQLTIDISKAAENRVYYNLDVTSLKGIERLIIKGLEVGSSKLLFLNLNVGDVDEYVLNTTLSVCRSSGKDDYYSTAEIGNKDGGVRMVYNFIKTDAQGTPSAFDGTLNLDKTVNGSVLAPRADITVLHNLNGTIIGKKVSTNGETHKCDVEKTGPVYSTKTYENVDLSTLSEPERNKLLHATAFTLYKTYDSGTGTLSDPVKVRNPVWDDVNKCAAILFGDGLENNTTYYLKETAAPEGYALSEDLYICQVNAIGQVTYTKQGSTNSSSTEPAYENLLQTTPITTTTASGESTTTTQTTTTTTVQTTTTTAPATTTTAAATTTQGIRIGVHKVWSDHATNSHDSDTVVVEIHRSTNPADVPDQAKITTTAVATTAAATVTTTGKSPPSGNTVQLDNVVFGTEIDLSAFDYTNITEIALKISDLASGGDGQVHIHPNYKSYRFADAESDGLIHIKLTPPTSSKLIIYRYNGTGTLESVFLYFDTTSQQGMDSIKPVLAAANGSSSPTWVQNLEIRKDTGWTATAENLPATDADGNPYYYWAVEKDFSGYDASYLYENSPGDKYITGKDGSITVCNTPSKTTGVVMPSTGGSGTFAHRLIGISLMTAVAGLCVLRRQKQFRSSA